MPESSSPGTFVLDATHAGFITHDVSIMVASCDAGRIPSLARALGCRVSPDRREVTLFLPVPRSTALLRDLRAGGGIAAVFTRPTTHETIQIKGTSCREMALDPHDRTIMRDYAAGFLRELHQIGYRDPFASAMMAAIDDEAVAIVFEPVSAFLQTPGPSAGTRLGTAS